MLKSISYKPSPVLQRYIKFYYSFEHTGEKSPYRITPDGGIEIIFNLGKPVSRQDKNENEIRQNNYYVVTRFTKNYFISHSGSVRMIGICFYPWGLKPFIKLPLSEISDNSYSQQDIFGCKINKLHEKIERVLTTEKAIKFIEEYFIGELNSSDSKDIIVEDAVRRIIQSKGSLRMDYLLNSYSLGIRGMEKRFISTIGVSAKTYSRVIKFQYALSLLHSDNLTSVGYRANYFDQPHFIHEFNFFAGINPKKYLAENNTVNQLISRTALDTDRT